MIHVTLAAIDCGSGSVTYRINKMPSDALAEVAEVPTASAAPVSRHRASSNGVQVGVALQERAASPSQHLFARQLVFDFAPSVHEQNNFCAVSVSLEWPDSSGRSRAAKTRIVGRTTKWRKTCVVVGSVSSWLRNLDAQIARVEPQIARVEAAIQAAEDKSNAATDTNERDYWRKEKEQLRKEKEQLRDEKEQLRDLFKLALLGRTAGAPSCLRLQPLQCGPCACCVLLSVLWNIASLIITLHRSARPQLSGSWSG
eukprot:646-Rhodomonas_salina.1